MRPAAAVLRTTLEKEREAAAERLRLLGDAQARLSDAFKAMSSEAKASAYIIGSLPFIMFGILFLMNPGYVTPLFTDPRGILMTGVGLATMGLGILVMMKMVRFEI